MKTDVWMPFYISDYLADTMHLTTEQHGAYCLLLFCCWPADGLLLDSDERFASICRCNPDHWRQSLRPILIEFFEVSNGYWTQQRVARERVRAKKLSNSKSISGSKGGRKTQANRVASGAANEQQTSTPSPSPSQVYTHTHKRRLHGIPQTAEEVISAGAMLNPKKSEAACRAFWNFYEGQARTNENGEIFWITSGDAVVTNWRVKLSGFEEKGKNEATNHRGNNGKGFDRNKGTFNEGKAHLYVVPKSKDGS